MKTPMFFALNLNRFTSIFTRDKGTYYSLKSYKYFNKFSTLQIFIASLLLALQQPVPPVHLSI